MPFILRTEKNFLPWLFLATTYFTSLGLPFRAAFLYKLKREQNKTTITYRTRQWSIKIEIKGSIAGLQLSSRWLFWLSGTQAIPSTGNSNPFSKKKKGLLFCQPTWKPCHMVANQEYNDLFTFTPGPLEHVWRPRRLSELVAYSRRRFAGGPLPWRSIGYPSLRAISPIWASEAASPLARAFSRDSLHSRK